MLGKKNNNFLISPFFKPSMLTAVMIGKSMGSGMATAAVGQEREGKGRKWPGLLPRENS